MSHTTSVKTITDVIYYCLRKKHQLTLGYTTSVTRPTDVVYPYYIGCASQPM